MSEKEPEGPEQEVGDGPITGGPGRDPGEPPREDPDRLERAMDPRCSRYLASVATCCSRYLVSVAECMEGLQQQVQQLISCMNDSWENDHNVLSSFKSSLLLQVLTLAEKLEERLFHLYRLHNERIEQQLQALVEVMERLDRVQDELHQVCCSMEAAYRDFCLQNKA